MKTVNKKKVFSQTKNKLFLTCSVLIVFACVGSYLTFMSRAASNGFYLSPAAATVTVGNNITIQVGLNYGSPVDTVQTYISYPSSLEVVGLPTVSEPYESDYENNTTTPGLIKIQRADFSDAPPIGDRIISTITFKAKSAGAATVAFTDNTYGVNSGTQLSIPLNNANYTLVGPSLPPPPSGSTTPPAPPSSSTNNSSAPKPSGRAASPKQSSTSAPANSSSAPPTTAPSGEPAAENTSEPPGSAAEENTTSSSETQGKTASTGTSEPIMPLTIITGVIFSVLLIGGVGAELFLRHNGHHEGLLGYLRSLRNSGGVPLQGNTPSSSPNTPPAGIYSDPHAKPPDSKHDF